MIASSDPAEPVEPCHRVVVLQRGRFDALEADRLTEPEPRLAMNAGFAGTLAGFAGTL
ncbi:hypothetical protein [Actinomadura mexicana]|nr:hypothetical protein [Actinomadura mexicana]